jgi:hypothetical protein
MTAPISVVAAAPNLAIVRVSLHDEVMLRPDYLLDDYSLQSSQEETKNSYRSVDTSARLQQQLPMLKKRAQIKVNSQLFVATRDYKETLKNSYESTQKTFR